MTSKIHLSHRPFTETILDISSPTAINYSPWKASLNFTGQRQFNCWSVFQPVIDIRKSHKCIIWK